MGKGRVLFFLGGAALVLYGGEVLTPGSSAPQVNAGRAAVGNVVQGVAGVADDAVSAVGPLAHDALGSLQASGVGNILGGSTTPTTAPGTVPAPQQPSTAQP
jgi:hypothetical protein